jgi:hypothetical protein
LYVQEADWSAVVVDDRDLVALVLAQQTLRFLEQLIGMYDLRVARHDLVDGIAEPIRAAGLEQPPQVAVGEEPRQ